MDYTGHRRTLQARLQMLQGQLAQIQNAQNTTQGEIMKVIGQLEFIDQLERSVDGVGETIAVPTE